MVRCLSFHQTYRCARSGVCCTSNWPIPVEADRLGRLQAAMATGALRARVSADQPWLAVPAGSDEPAILASAHAACVFYDATGEHRCRIQSALGHDALPLACRQFPRVSVLDPGGASVVLSLYCPTAARMLDAPGDVTVVESPAAFPSDGEYVGLDARSGWPPILRPGVLMDWPSWWAFERRAVDLIANRSASPEDALARLRVVVERVRGWRVGDGWLEGRIDEAFESAMRAHPDAQPLDETTRLRLLADVDAAIPAALRPSGEPSTPIRESAARHLRFLASHAFANWAIHLGEDLRAWLRSIDTAHALLASGFSVGEADLRLRHLRG